MTRALGLLLWALAMWSAAGLAASVVLCALLTWAKESHR